jgi:hypothetical protein
MDCWSSIAFNRVALSGKSKKVSEFSDSALQVGQTIHEVRHANYSMRRRRRES